MRPRTGRRYDRRGNQATSEDGGRHGVASDAGPRTGDGADTAARGGARKGAASLRLRSARPSLRRRGPTGRPCASWLCV
ncbi:hypothetical protein FRZ40_38060 [Paraburkholderia azotifigens]|uniref:Uncharacterized protein n=1 Tax=Paraburkholderia azotifigens TaxID=2057004 RepID=A0A5C6V6M6_9BURK|nr:hypothetical protein FRZ40_38060 [Paraburkholderia azotifigens]